MAEIRERRLETGAVSINYAEIGDGSPLVILHGGSARWQHLESLVRELADRWHVYAPDLRGHGRSGHVSKRYRLTDYADDIVAFLERVTGPAAVFGHSLGGQVALVAAARRPDLVNALAIGDAPLSTSRLRKGLQKTRPMLEEWRDLAASSRSTDEIADALRAMWVPEFEGRSGRAAELLPTASPWFDFMAGCLHELDPSMLDAVIEFDEMHRGFEPGLLAKISCRVLLVQADPKRGGGLSDEDVALARSLRPDLQVGRISEAGHSLYPYRIGPVLREFFADRA